MLHSTDIKKENISILSLFNVANDSHEFILHYIWGTVLPIPPTATTKYFISFFLSHFFLMFENIIIVIESLNWTFLFGIGVLVSIGKWKKKYFPATKKTNFIETFKNDKIEIWLMQAINIPNCALRTVFIFETTPLI